MILEYFTAPWCAPCKTMLPMVEDVWKGEMRIIDYMNGGSELIEDAGVLSFPTMRLLDVDKEITRHTGVMGRGDFERWIKVAE